MCNGLIALTPPVLGTGYLSAEGGWTSAEAEQLKLFTMSKLQGFVYFTRDGQRRPGVASKKKHLGYFLTITCPISWDISRSARSSE